MALVLQVTVTSDETGETLVARTRWPEMCAFVLTVIAEATNCTHGASIT